MLTRLREQDPDTVLAEGPQYDLEKVLETAIPLIRTLQGRASMQFGGVSATYRRSYDTLSKPLDPPAIDSIADAFRATKAESFDATDLGFHIEFGPFMAAVSLLGFESLVGPVFNCVTSMEKDWRELDVEPSILLLQKVDQFGPIPKDQLEFLEKLIGTFEHAGLRRDIGGLIPSEPMAIRVSFPHDRFGAGFGTLRIQRKFDGMPFGYLGDES